MEPSKSEMKRHTEYIGEILDEKEAGFPDLGDIVGNLVAEHKALKAAVRAHWLLDVQQVSGSICEPPEGHRYGIFPVWRVRGDVERSYALVRIGEQIDSGSHENTEIVRWPRFDADAIVAAAEAIMPLHLWSGFNPDLP